MRRGGDVLSTVILPGCFDKLFDFDYIHDLCNLTIKARERVREPLIRGSRMCSERARPERIMRFYA
jgi:hypothetical protein